MVLSCASAGDSIFNMCYESFILLLSTVSHRQYVQSLMIVCSPFKWSIWVQGGRDDSILSAIQAKWPPKSCHQRNSCQILQNCATELCWACSKTIIMNSPIRGFFNTDSFMSYVYEFHCFIGIFVGPLNTNCIKYQANQKWAKLELSLSCGEFKERKQEGLRYDDKGTYDNLREGDRNIVVYVYINHRRCTRQDWSVFLKKELTKIV